MKSLAIRISSIVMALIIASGCAGHHMVPIENYSLHQKPGTSPVISAVFDQNGCLYPQSPNQFGFRMPTGRYSGDYAYTICDDVEEHRSNQDELTSLLANEISAALASNPGTILVILIHGFNSSFSSGTDDMQLQRSRIEEINPDGKYVFLKVYWDGLHDTYSLFTAPGGFWFEALTYSNFAGHRGLRSVLNKIEHRPPLVFVTKSRGAAVALSAVVDPFFTDEIACRNRRMLAGLRAFEPQRFSQIGFAMIAPAIGNGHINPTAMQSNSSGGLDDPSRADKFGAIRARMAATFNDKDPITCKGLGCFTYRWRGLNPARGFGDTGLNSDEEFALNVAKAVNESGGEFTSIRMSFVSHRTEDYLENRDHVHCIYFLSGAVPFGPNGGCDNMRLK